METVRGILHRGKSHLSQKSVQADLEQGGSSSRTSQMPNGKGAANRDDSLPTLISPTERLQTFRLLVGITNDRSFSTSMFSSSHRTAPNIGIYTRVCSYEQAAGRRYKWFSLLINFCLALQLVVAAALTALGAAGPTVVMNNDQSAINDAQNNKRSVTALGAINTVIAGFLTYLKGSGLPGRFRYYQNEWKRIREMIEQRERELSRPDCTLDVYQVITAIEDMYDEACQDIEASVPDSFHSPSKAKRDRDAAPGGQIAALRGLPDRFTARANDEKAEYLDKMKELEARYGAVVSSTVSEAVQQGKKGGDKATEAAATLKEVEADVDHTQRQVQTAVSEVEDFARRRLGLGGGSSDAKPEHKEDSEKK